MLDLLLSVAGTIRGLMHTTDRHATTMAYSDKIELLCDNTESREGPFRARVA